MLIDTHAHINFNDFKDDGQQVIKKALDADVWLINAGAQYSTSQRAVEYAKKFKTGVYAAVGLHPIHLEDRVIKENINGKEIEVKTKKEDFDLMKYYELAQDKKVVAIGETGLDYKHSQDKELQKQVFLQQIDLSCQLGKPIIIHCREAYKDLLAILADFKSGCSACPYSCPGASQSNIEGVVHCFGGNLEQAKQFMDHGLYLGFNGLITYVSDYDKMIEKLPLEKIILETDCPYLTPVPHRGKRNEPLYVKYVAEKIAQIKNISFEEVAKVTTQNARHLFKI